MRKKLLCFLLCLFLLPLGVIRDAGGDGITRCLLIGCDQFVSMPDTEPAGANNVKVAAGGTYDIYFNAAEGKEKTIGFFRTDGLCRRT